MAELLTATLDMAREYAQWFVNRRPYTRQSERPHPESGRHYYFRPKNGGGSVGGLPRDPAAPGR